MGIFFRDSNLKKIFREAPKSDLLKDLASRIKALIDFAYARVENVSEAKKKKEENKDNTKGVAFIRQVWKPESKTESVLKEMVNDKPLLELAKLYKVGLQANAGWFSDLSDKLIQNYVIAVLHKLAKDEKYHPLFLALIGAKAFSSNMINEKEVEKAFIEKIKTMETNGFVKTCENWEQSLKKGTNKVEKQVNIQNLQKEANKIKELNPKLGDEAKSLEKKLVKKEQKEMNKVANYGKKKEKDDKKTKKQKNSNYKSPLTKEEKQKKEENKKKEEDMKNKQLENELKKKEEEKENIKNKSQQEIFNKECFEIYKKQASNVKNNWNKTDCWNKVYENKQDLNEKNCCLNKDGMKKLKKLKEHYSDCKIPSFADMEKMANPNKKH